MSKLTIAIESRSRGKAQNRKTEAALLKRGRQATAIRAEVEGWTVQYCRLHAAWKKDPVAYYKAQLDAWTGDEGGRWRMPRLQEVSPVEFRATQEEYAGGYVSVGQTGVRAKRGFGGDGNKVFNSNSVTFRPVLPSATLPVPVKVAGHYDYPDPAAFFAYGRLFKYGAWPVVVDTDLKYFPPDVAFEHSQSCRHGIYEESACAICTPTVGTRMKRVRCRVCKELYENCKYPIRHSHGTVSLWEGGVADDVKKLDGLNVVPVKVRDTARTEERNRKARAKRAENREFAEAQKLTAEIVVVLKREPLAGGVEYLRDELGITPDALFPLTASHIFNWKNEHWGSRTPAKTLDGRREPLCVCENCQKWYPSKQRTEWRTLAEYVTGGEWADTATPKLLEIVDKSARDVRDINARLKLYRYGDRHWQPKVTAGTTRDRLREGFELTKIFCVPEYKIEGAYNGAPLRSVGLALVRDPIALVNYTKPSLTLYCTNSQKWYREQAPTVAACNPAIAVRITRHSQLLHEAEYRRELSKAIKEDYNPKLWSREVVDLIGRSLAGDLEDWNPKLVVKVKPETDEALNRILREDYCLFTNCATGFYSAYGDPEERHRAFAALSNGGLKLSNHDCRKNKNFPIAEKIATYVREGRWTLADWSPGSLLNLLLNLSPNVPE